VAEKRDVLVQAPAATRVRIKTAAVALHPPGLRHLDIIIMQSGVGSLFGTGAKGNSAGGASASPPANQPLSMAA
jgi:hypothetical protein